VILDLPLPTVEAFDRLEASRRYGEKLLPVLLKQAKLEFRMVDDEQQALAACAGYLRRSSSIGTGTEGQAGVWFLPLSSEQKPRPVASFLSGRPPPGRQFGLEKRVERAGKTWFRSYLLERPTGITGDHITDVRVAFDGEGGQPGPTCRSPSYHRSGLFAALTRSNVKRRMAIVLDGEVNLGTGRPVGDSRRHLLDPIGGLKPVNEVLQEAKDLSLVLSRARFRAAAPRPPIEPINPR